MWLWMATSKARKEKLGIQVMGGVNFYCTASLHADKEKWLEKCHGKPSPTGKCEILTPDKSVSLQNTTISVIISEAVPALSSRTAHTSTTATEACVCHCSWGQCITAQAQIRDVPKSLSLAQPFILFYPPSPSTPMFPVSFFKIT